MLTVDLQGSTVDDSLGRVLFEMEMVAEGHYVTKSVFDINQKLGVEMPIATAVYNIVYGRISAAVEMRIPSEKLG